MRKPARQVNGTLASFRRGRLHGFLFQPNDDSGEVLIVPRALAIPKNHLRAVKAQVSRQDVDVDLQDSPWIKHPLLRQSLLPNSEIQRVIESWRGAFAYVEEDLERGIIGLRRPQIGAVHAIHAHWSVSDDPATIVMPTGTGKTEAMLSILVSARCHRLLVVVPTRALRAQIATKFLSLGILKDPGCAVLSSRAKRPVVGTLEHVPKSVDDVNTFFTSCQVIVMTNTIAARCSTDIQNRIADHCSHLFIDEAHHAEAPKWRTFKKRFRDTRVVQFTATPFREDGKPLDGKIIYKYSLRQAQREGYFCKIDFRQVFEFDSNRADARIAEMAVDQLRADVAKGHILMARVASIARAEEVFEIYKQYDEYNPLQLHTGITSARQRELARRLIVSGKSRIVVCVDMLGEGFDLPELKIAAFHDIRKSLPVTLQLAGRFTRKRPDLGDATFIANTADVEVREELRRLYSRDPDWNALLPELSDEIIEEQLSLQQYFEGFVDPPTEIPLRAIRPAMSAVVYRTKCDHWSPEDFRAGIPGIAGCAHVYATRSETEHALVVITVRRDSLEWADVEDMSTWHWDLYVVIWSPEQSLLYIHGSSKTSVYKPLAEAIGGGDATLIAGQQVFRVFGGVHRLRLQNVGLTEQLGRNIRYTGRMGANVESGLGDAPRQRARKSVLAGHGFEDGGQVTLGASRKGRIWSHQRGRIDQLAEWCKGIGGKLLNSAIDPDNVLKGTLRTTTIRERPTKMPIAVDWPEGMYRTRETTWSIRINGHEETLSGVDIALVKPDTIGELVFSIASESIGTEIRLELLDIGGRPNYRFVVVGDYDVMIQRGNWQTSLTEYFYENPPIIWFADGSSLEGNEYVELQSEYSLFDPARIDVWGWEGVDITNESQGPGRDQSSIQGRVIRELKNRDYVVIVDDDGKGEAADVVAIGIVGPLDAPTSIDVEFYHCKYSGGVAPGGRIGDLYEVCGQAQKSTSWMCSQERKRDIFTHLLRREAARRRRGGTSRYEVGDDSVLRTIRDNSYLCPTNLKVFVVQPGLSKARMSHAQRQLVGVTENYLFETFQLPFGLIASA